MISQLLLAKRQFIEAVAFAKRPDPVSCGISISLFQDAAETMVWAIIKERNLNAKDNAAFTSNLALLQGNGVLIPQISKLSELNKARVGFKHYGNLPAPEEARKYQGYVEDFLRDVATSQFAQEFDALSLADLVTFPDVKSKLKSAENYVAEGKFREAVGEATIAKAMLFSKLGTYIPKVDRNLAQADQNILAGDKNLQAFGYIGRYLEFLRELSIVSLLQLSLSDYSFLKTTLFAATQTMTGEWKIQETSLLTYNETICKSQISYLVDISIRMEGLA